jgi:hypothetical protein
MGNLPDGWKEIAKDYYEHESGAVVHTSAHGFVQIAFLGGDPIGRPKKWRAHKSKRYSSMLDELFDSKEEAFEALAEQG